MIKHHPADKLLHAYVQGELPSSLTAAVAIHCDLCPSCQQQVDVLTEQASEQAFTQVAEPKAESAELDDESSLLNADMMQMIDEITQDISLEQMQPALEKQVVVNERRYQLPAALAPINIGSFRGLGKLSRAKLALNEGQIHSHLLYMAPGGEVPHHTHKGFELTLVLDGEFHDEAGRYQVGDFVMQNSEHFHQPISDEGCLCLTVVSDALTFTQGFSRLLNPIGSLIY